MKDKVCLFITFIFLCGCASIPAVGSKTWYKQRTQEIETSYQNKEITKAEYITLKNQTDEVHYNTTHHK